jgi:hypothetical protein
MKRKYKAHRTKTGSVGRSGNLEIVSLFKEEK